MPEKEGTGVKAFGCTTEREVLDIILAPENGIEFVRVMFPDILGRPMDFSFPSSELSKAFKEGKGFDGSSVEGFVRIEESDLVIKPDPKTFRLLPWEYKGFDGQVRWREAIMFGDILTPDGEALRGRLAGPAEECPREEQGRIRLRRFQVRAGARVLHLPGRPGPPPRPTRGDISSPAATGRSARRSSSS